MSELGAYELPKRWRWKTIPDLVGDDGLFVDGDWVETKDQDPNGDVRLVQLADVGDGNYRNKSARFLTSAKAAELGCTFLRDGDVLIARMPDPLGRACIFPGDPKPSVTVVDVCIVRSSEGGFDHRRLSSFVNAHPFRSAISGLQAGSTRKRISRGNLGTIPLPVPPREEQQRIVSEIEKQFTRLEAGVTALRQAQAKLKHYRAATLKAACEGCLVSTEAELARKENRSYEPAEILLERILKKRREKWNGKGRCKEPAVQDFAELAPLPEGWSWATIEQLGRIETGNTPPKADAANYGTDIPFVKPPELLDCSVSSAADNLSAVGASMGRLAPACTILVSCIGNLGKTGLTSREIAFNQQINAIIPTVVESARWIFYAVQETAFRRQLESVASATTIAIVNKGKFSGLLVPLPPLAEQKRIVAEVERRLSVVDELKAILSANLQRAGRLRQSVLHRAFSGAV